MNKTTNDPPKTRTETAPSQNFPYQYQVPNEFTWSSGENHTHYHYHYPDPVTQKLFNRCTIALEKIAEHLARLHIIFDIPDENIHQKETENGQGNRDNPRDSK